MSIINAKTRARADVPTPAAGYAALFFDSDNANVPTIKLPDASFQPLESGPPGPDGTPGHFGIDFAGDWVAGAYAQYKIVNHRGSSWSASRATFAGEEPGVNPADAVLGGNTAVADVASGDADTQQQFTVTQPITVTVVSVDAFGLDIPAATAVELRTDAGVVLGSGATSGITLAGTSALVALATPTPLLPATTYRLYVNSDNAGVRTGAATPAGDVATVGNLYLAGVLTAGKNLRFSLTGYPTSPWLDLGLGGSGVATGRTFPPSSSVPWKTFSFEPAFAYPQPWIVDFYGGVGSDPSGGQVITTDAPVGLTQSWQMSRPKTAPTPYTNWGLMAYTDIDLSPLDNPTDSHLIKMKIKYLGSPGTNQEWFVAWDDPYDPDGDDGLYSPVLMVQNGDVSPGDFFSNPGSVDANGWREVEFMLGGGTTIFHLTTLITQATVQPNTDGWAIADIRAYSVEDGALEGQLFYEQQGARMWNWGAGRGWTSNEPYYMSDKDDISYNYETARGSHSGFILDIDSIRFMDARDILGNKFSVRPGIVCLSFKGSLVPVSNGGLATTFDLPPFPALGAKLSQKVPYSLAYENGSRILSMDVELSRPVATTPDFYGIDTRIFFNAVEWPVSNVQIGDFGPADRDYGGVLSYPGYSNTITGPNSEIHTIESNMTCKVALPSSDVWDVDTAIDILVRVWFMPAFTQP